MLAKTLHHLDAMLSNVVNLVTNIQKFQVDLFVHEMKRLTTLMFLVKNFLLRHCCLCFIPKYNENMNFNKDSLEKKNWQN